MKLAVDVIVLKKIAPFGTKSPRIGGMEANTMAIMETIIGILSVLLQRSLQFILGASISNMSCLKYFKVADSLREVGSVSCSLFPLIKL